MTTTPSEAQLLEYLDEVIGANSAGRIEWIQANPTTYIWDIPRRARITLQQTTAVRGEPVPGRPGVQKPVQVTTYVFQVQDQTNNTVRMQTQADQSSPLGKKLALLYDNITAKLTQKNLDFLKSLVPKG